MTLHQLLLVSLLPKHYLAPQVVQTPLRAEFMMRDWAALTNLGSLMQQTAIQPRQRLLCHSSVAVILLGVQHNIVSQASLQQARRALANKSFLMFACWTNKMPKHCSSIEFTPMRLLMRSSKGQQCRYAAPT